MASFRENTDSYIKHRRRFAPGLIQRPVLKRQPGHRHLREDVGDGAGIVLDINAAADIGGGVADTLARNDCAANIDGISATTRKIEGSSGNDDTFEVDATIEFDVAVHNENAIPERTVARQVQIARRIIELRGPT